MQLDEFIHSAACFICNCALIASFEYLAHALKCLLYQKTTVYLLEKRTYLDRKLQFAATKMVVRNIAHQKPIFLANYFWFKDF